MTSFVSRIFLVILSIALGIASRLIPHAHNFTPVTAIALFISAHVGLRASLATVVSTMVISDMVIGSYQWQIMAAVYGSFMVAAIIGSFMNKRYIGHVVVSTLASSLSFFLITNWAVWQFGTLYPHSFSGLLQSYGMALPFFKNSLAGDLLYVGILFGAMYGILNVKWLIGYLIPRLSPIMLKRSYQ